MYFSIIWVKIQHILYLDVNEVDQDYHSLAH